MFTQNNAMSAAVRIVLIYLAVGILWIATSDWIVETILPESQQAVAQLAKGMAYVLVTGVLLGIVVYMYASRIYATFAAQQDMLRDTVRALSAAVEKRDPYTARHTAVTARLALEIAHRMGLSEKDRLAVELGSLLHDLGKISVPAELLSKPTKLSEAEYDLVKLHPQAGYDILSAVKFDNDVPSIVRDHHERLDGSGYPRGLKGDEISQVAQVVAVADVAEAMTSHRPYRTAFSIDETIAELQRGTGKLFNANAVAACVSALNDPGFNMSVDPQSPEGRAIEAVAPGLSET